MNDNDLIMKIAKAEYDRRRAAEGATLAPRWGRAKVAVRRGFLERAQAQLERDRQVAEAGRREQWVQHAPAREPEPKRPWWKFW